VLESSTSKVTKADVKTGPPAGVPPGDVGPLRPDEFAHIPARRGRPPLLALGAVALALFLGYQLRNDLSYALSSATPVQIGDARALAERPAAELPINRTVRLSGVPERESAVILDTRGSWKFTQLFRLRSTGGRVFVRRAPDPLPVALAERDEFVGRLLPFGQLSFGQSIARYFAARVSATHFFRPADVHAALAAGLPLRLRDLAGDEVTLAAEDRLYLDILRPGELEVELPRLRFPDQAAAAQAVVAAGGRVTGRRETPDRWIFTVAVSGAAGEGKVTSALGDIDRAARLRPARDTIEAKVSALSPAGGPAPALHVRRDPAPSVLASLSSIGAIRTRSPVQIPADALLLIEGERPRDAWKSVVILGFLVAFVVVNLLALRRPA
jgi:hypothetical protein